MTRPVMTSETRKRVRVRRTTSALHGGNLALADFHVIPPFGRSIVARTLFLYFKEQDCLHQVIAKSARTVDIRENKPLIAT